MASNENIFGNVNIAEGYALVHKATRKKDIEIGTVVKLSSLSPPDYLKVGTHILYKRWSADKIDLGDGVKYRLVQVQNIGSMAHDLLGWFDEPKDKELYC